MRTPSGSQGHRDARCAAASRSTWCSTTTPSCTCRRLCASSKAGIDAAGGDVSFVIELRLFKPKKKKTSVKPACFFSLSELDLSRKTTQLSLEVYAKPVDLRCLAAEQKGAVRARRRHRAYGVARAESRGGLVESAKKASLNSSPPKSRTPVGAFVSTLSTLARLHLEDGQSPCRLLVRTIGHRLGVGRPRGVRPRRRRLRKCPAPNCALTPQNRARSGPGTRRAPPKNGELLHRLPHRGSSTVSGSNSARTRTSLRSSFGAAHVIARRENARVPDAPRKAVARGARAPQDARATSA